MKVYVVEIMGDELYQCGMSLNRQEAEKACAKINERQHLPWKKAFVSEYELNNKYTEFDCC